MHRLQELGRPGAQDEVVIATLRAAQAVLVRGEENGRESCLEWIHQCTREGEGQVDILFTFIANLNPLLSRSDWWQKMLQLLWGL